MRCVRLSPRSGATLSRDECRPCRRSAPMAGGRFGRPCSFGLASGDGSPAGIFVEPVHPPRRSLSDCARFRGAAIVSVMLQHNALPATCVVRRRVMLNSILHLRRKSLSLTQSVTHAIAAPHNHARSFRAPSTSGTRVVGAMPTALRGHVNPTRRFPDMPTQSRGHGTLRRSRVGYAETLCLSAV